MTPGRGPGNIVTSGPFTLQTWRSYDRLVVVRNPYFWDAANVKLDRITFYPLEDQTTMMNLYKAGEVDAVLNHTPPAAWVDTLRSKKDYMDEPEVAIEFLHVQHHAPADERRARPQGVQCRGRQSRARRTSSGPPSR